MYNYYCEQKKKKLEAEQKKIERREKVIKEKRKSINIKLNLEIVDNLSNKYEERVKDFVLEVNNKIILDG
jgi:hypothetical protein